MLVTRNILLKFKATFCYVNKGFPEQWIEQIEVEGEHKYRILHSHYMKKIGSQRVTSKESALSMQTKISIVVSDLVRVMRNVSEPCDEKERSTHVQHYIHRIQFSGYPQEDRVLVYKKAKKVFENIVERDRIGKCPIYRGKFWQRNERDKKYKWYEKGGGGS